MRYEVQIGILQDDAGHEDLRNILVTADDEVTAAFRAGAVIGPYLRTASGYEVVSIRSEADAR